MLRVGESLGQVKEARGFKYNFENVYFEPIYS